MNDGLKFMLGVVFVLLVAGIVIVVLAGALMYLDAYLKTTMFVH